MPERHSAALHSRVAGLDAAQDPREVPLILLRAVSNASDGFEPGSTLHVLAHRLHENGGSNLLLIEAQVAIWPIGRAALLAETYGLSQAEAEICARLSRAHKPTGIALRRNSSLAAARNQIKLVLVKTGAGTQTELVRLLHLLMRFAEGHGPQNAAVLTAQGKMVTVQLTFGTLMPMELHGPPSGRPVIFVHGILDGVRLTQNMRQALTQRGFRFNCPTRPWFGDTRPDYGRDETAPERFAGNMQEVCVSLGIKQAVVLGHMAGSVPAFAIARAAPDIVRGPDNVRGIVNVAGGVPIANHSQFTTMSHRQRAVAHTACFAHACCPLFCAPASAKLPAAAPICSCDRFTPRPP